MKKWLLFAFFSLSTTFFPLEAEEKEEATEQRTFSVPDPLELEKGWWGYFDMPADQLPEKIATFRDRIKKIKSSLNAEQHREILELMEQVVPGLEFLVKKKSQIAPSDPIQLQLLKNYTIPQLFEIYENLLQTKNEIGPLQEKIESVQILLNRTQSLSDKHILSYHELPPSSYERLHTGLKIIETRTEVAFYNVDINEIEKRTDYLKKKKRLLNDELSNAKKKIKFEDESLDSLSKQWKESKIQAEEAHNKLYRIEKQFFQKQEEELQDNIICCTWEYKILTQRIRSESLNIIALLNHLQLELYKILNDEDSDDSEAFQKSHSKWHQTLSDSNENLKQWKKQLDEGHVRVNRLIVKLFNEKETDFSEDSKISDVHFELTKSFASLEELGKNIAKAELLNNMVESQFVEDKSITETWTTSLKLQWNQTCNSIREITSVTIFRINDEPITVGIFLKSILIVLAAILFSKYFRKFLVKRQIVVRAFSKSTEYIVLRFIHYGIVLLSLLFALSFFGLNFTNLAIIAGALGVGIGFGLQSIVSNILSGFMLLLNRYLKVGDIIELKDDFLGRVISIDLQNTQVETFDGLNIVIPNSHLTSQQLINWTMYTPCRRYRVPFGVAYGSDKEQIKKAIIEAVTELPFVVSEAEYYPSPQIRLKEYGDNSVNFELVAWVDLNKSVPHGTCHSSLMWEIDNVLKANNINIPFPQRDIYVKEFPKNTSV